MVLIYLLDFCIQYGLFKKNFVLNFQALAIQIEHVTGTFLTTNFQEWKICQHFNFYKENNLWLILSFNSNSNLWGTLN